MKTKKRRHKAPGKSFRKGLSLLAVVGAKDRPTNQVRAIPRGRPSRASSGIGSGLGPSSTDGTKVYRSLPNQEGVRHSVGEYVRGQAHTNGVESFWSLLKRGYVGTFHKLSPKHFQRYVNEFSGRQNIRSRDTLDQMRSVLRPFQIRC